jgi:hypothetical protein
MSKPKKWDTMTLEEQIAWKANRRRLQNNYRLKNLERCREYDRKRRLENAERSIAYWAKYKCKEKPIDHEKEQKKREHKAKLQKIRYHANKEKALGIARKYRERKQREKRLEEIKAIDDAKKAKPAKLDMSKVLAFISKKDGPKSQKPITPNMAKVREFIKYA